MLTFLQNLNGKKAAGPDSINPKKLKTCCKLPIINEY